MIPKKQNECFVSWFRHASPYIHAHRDSTFVICFDGEVVADDSFPNLVHDIALLHSIGTRIVLVHGARPQIEERLALRGAEIKFVDGLRVTDQQAITCVREAAGFVRVEVESLLSMGVANSPMAGAEIEVDSGNFVVAKPLGIINGVDYQYTGEVRKIKARSIQKRLDTGSIVLISPLGYSPAGDVFNLNAADVASTIAISLRADKLIFLTEEKIVGRGKKVLSNLLPAEVDLMLERRKSLGEPMQRILRNCATACRKGVARSHILHAYTDGVLLTEIFTRDGVGTLITAEPSEITRQANVNDVVGIIELIEPLEQAGILVRRSRELIESEIGNFTIIELEGTIIGCAALYPFEQEKMAELACLAVHPDYRNGGRGEELLTYCEGLAKKKGMKQLFVLSTRTTHWFKERGLELAALDVLPRRKKDLINLQRNSKVYIKSI